MFQHNCNQFVLHAKVSKVLAILLNSNQEVLVFYPMISRVLDQSLCFTNSILPTDFLCMFICWTAAIFLLTFANWPFSLVVGQTMTKVCELIGNGSFLRATNWYFSMGLHCKWISEHSCSSFGEVILSTKSFEIVEFVQWWQLQCTTLHMWWHLFQINRHYLKIMYCLIRFLN